MNYYSINKNKSIIIFIITLIYLNLINCLEIISSTAIKKEINILGVDLSFALLEIQFDDELNTFDSLACPNYTCIQQTVSPISTEFIDCSCDYTDINECPKKRDTRCTNDCPLEFIENISNQMFNVKLCNAQDDWELIELDNEMVYSTSTLMQFRIKAPSYQSTCDSMFLKISPIQGYPMTFFGSVPSQDLTRFVSGSKLETNSIYNICPSDNWNSSQHYTYTKSYTQDTYFIIIDPQDTNVTFSILIKSSSVPPVNNNLVNCASTLSTHKCINIGENTFGELLNSTQLDYYVLNVERKGWYFFQFPSIFLSTSIFISNTPGNLFPNESTSQWVRKNSYENYITLYIPDNTVYYICVSGLAATNYSFVVTDIGQVFSNPISKMSLQQGAFALVSSTMLIPPLAKDQNEFYICNSQADCNPYSILFPTIDINPLWPVPSILYDVEDFDFKSIVYDISGDIINTNFKPKSYQAAILLSYGNGKGYLKEYISYEDVLNSSMKFLSTLLDSTDYLPIDITIEGFKDITSYNCNYQEFKRVFDLINGGDNEEVALRQFTSTSQLNNWRYRLGVLMLNYAWIGCTSQANQLLNIVPVEKNISTYYCPYKQNEIGYSTDPCCNITYQFYQCCNPRYVVVQSWQYNGVVNELVSSQCKPSSIDCTKSVLTEYGNYLSFSTNSGIVGGGSGGDKDNSNSDCGNDPSILSTQIQNSLYSTLRNCQDSILNPPWCTSDTDCNSFSTTNGKCDLYTRKCLVNYEQLDLKYVSCVFNGLSPATLYSFTSKTSYTNESIQEKYNQHLQFDCIGTGSYPSRTTYQYSTNDAFIGITPAKHCLDKSCKTAYNSLFDIYYSGWKFQKEFAYDQSNCNEYGNCPKLKCNSNNVNCNSNCNQSPFCGYCNDFDGSSCFTITASPNITEASCKTAEPICLLSNGNYIYNISKDNCESTQGTCTSNCGFKCIGADTTNSLQQENYCILGQIKEEIPCVSNGYSWSKLFRKCINFNATTKSACGINNVWYDCIGRTVDHCDNKQKEGICKLMEIPCKSKVECENSGTCSDWFYFSPENVQYYGKGFGKCMKNHTFLQRDNSKIVSCQNGESDSPVGCFTEFPIILSRVECETRGYKWWVASSTKEQCTSNYGCKILDQESFANLPFNYRYNEMNQEQCENCSNYLKYKWTNKFEWKPATWLPGIHIEQPNWYGTNKSSFIPREYKASFNYVSFYNDLIDAIGKQTSDFYRSETYCKKERNQNNLNSIACSCSDNQIDPSVCFESSSTPLLGLINQCDGNKNSTLSFKNGQLLFQKNSVLPGCQIITVSLISKLIFFSTTPEALSSNFVTYKKPDNFGILNENKAIIGTILTDGIIVKSEFVILNITICFNLFTITNDGSSVPIDTVHDKYPEFDFAFKNGIEINSSDGGDNDTLGSNFNNLYPLQIEPFFIGDEIEKQICIIQTNVQPNSQYFLINRKQGNWETMERELFDSATKSLLYVLAVLFLLVTFYGIYQITLIGIIFNNQKKVNNGQTFSFRNSFQITHLLTCLVTLFIFLRSIYFFLMPRGYLSTNPVIDYVLVVLPTFIYFTSFIVMIAIWYMYHYIVFLMLKNSSSTTGSTKRLYQILFGVNIILYILFVVIVLVFQYSVDNPMNDHCGTRIVITVKNSKPQIIVSILYAVIQAILSLLLGSSFAYLGSSLYLTLKKANFSNFKSDHQKKSIKIFILTVCCATGFILHCIFILILVSTDFNSIAFSFIGLFLTEILPAASILYCFDQRLNILKSSPTTQNNNNNGSDGGDSFGSTSFSLKKSNVKNQKSLKSSLKNSNNHIEFNNGSNNGSGGDNSINNTSIGDINIIIDPTTHLNDTSGNNNNNNIEEDDSSSSKTLDSISYHFNQDSNYTSNINSLNNSNSNDIINNI